MEKIYDVSEGKAYYSQRNNGYICETRKVDVSNKMCNVTSYIMAMAYNMPEITERLKKEAKGEQLENVFLHFIHNDSAVLSFYKKNAPSDYKKWMKSKNLSKEAVRKIKMTPPEQYHYLLAYAFNKLVNVPNAVTFATNVLIERMIHEIVHNNKAVVVSGVFNKLHHIVTLVGCKVKDVEKDINPDNIEYFIIDDPYGDFTTQYKVHNGNNIEIPTKDFIKILKPLTNDFRKFCHIWN